MPNLFVTITKDVYISCVRMCVQTPVLHGAFKVAIAVPVCGLHRVG